MAALFIFSVNFAPLHLALETHLDDLFASCAGAAEGQSLKIIRADAEENDHHALHFASDHLLRLAPQTASHSVRFDWATAETYVPAFSPTLQTPHFLTERQNRPGIPPPDPLQPRAPPFV